MTTRRKRAANPAQQGEVNPAELAPSLTNDTGPVETVGIQIAPADDREQSQKPIIEQHQVDEQPIFDTMEALEESGQSFTSTVVKGGRECRTMSGILLYRGA